MDLNLNAEIQNWGWSPELQNVTFMADISVFKVLEGWSKKCRKPPIFIKLSVFGANSTNFDEVLSLNQLYVILFSAFLLPEVIIHLNFI